MALADDTWTIVYQAAGWNPKAYEWETKLLSHIAMLVHMFLIFNQYSSLILLLQHSFPCLSWMNILSKTLFYSWMLFLVLTLTCFSHKWLLIPYKLKDMGVTRWCDGSKNGQHWPPFHTSSHRCKHSHTQVHPPPTHTCTSDSLVLVFI